MNPIFFNLPHMWSLYTWDFAIDILTQKFRTGWVHLACEKDLKLKNRYNTMFLMWSIKTVMKTWTQIKQQCVVETLRSECSMATVTGVDCLSVPYGCIFTCFFLFYRRIMQKQATHQMWPYAFTLPRLEIHGQINLQCLEIISYTLTLCKIA